MFQKMNKMLDKVSEYLAPRKGLLPLIGIVFHCRKFYFTIFSRRLVEDFKPVSASWAGNCHFRPDARLGVIICSISQGAPALFSGGIFISNG